MMVSTAETPLLKLADLKVEFSTRRGDAFVLNGISLSVKPGETLGIVGESGSGKSMTALAVMRLIPSPPGRISSGTISWKGEELRTASESRMREIRGNEISMIFQEPMTALNPVLTVGQQIAEALVIHRGMSNAEARRQAKGLLVSVKIPDAASRLDQYPHQLSGGMRQRVMIAIALACSPSLLIADEPTTALDVTVQAQIFELLRDIQAEQGTAIILITHDMGAISEMADRVAVMYAGHIVEEGSTAEILARPRHPYTRGLIACVPELGAGNDTRPPLAEIPGVVPSIWELGVGCPFAQRCSHSMPRCLSEMPPLSAAGLDHLSACWLESADRERGAIHDE